MRKYFEIFKFELKSKFNFRVDYFFDLISFAMHVFIFNQLWEFILKGKIVLGYSRPEIIWYIVIGEMLYNSIGKTYKRISEMIKSGDVANMLTKPISFLKYIIAQEMSFVINLAVNFVSAIILGSIMGGKIEISFMQIVMFSVSLIFAAILFVFIQVFIGMLAFITEENDSYYFVISKGMLLLIFTPLEFYPKAISKVLQFLPTTYAIYPVGKILVHFELENALRLILFQALSVCVLFIVLNLLNIKGVKNINVNGG